MTFMIALLCFVITMASFNKHAKTSEMKNAFEKACPNVTATVRTNKNTGAVTGINIEGGDVVNRFCVKTTKFDSAKVDLQLNQADVCDPDTWDQLRELLRTNGIKHMETHFKIGDDWHTALEIKGVSITKWISVYKIISGILESFVCNDEDVDYDEHKEDVNESAAPVISQSTVERSEPLTLESDFPSLPSTNGKKVGAPAPNPVVVEKFIEVTAKQPQENVMFFVNQEYTPPSQEYTPPSALLSQQQTLANIRQLIQFHDLESARLRKEAEIFEASVRALQAL